MYVITVAQRHWHVDQDKGISDVCIVYDDVQPQVLYTGWDDSLYQVSLAGDTLHQTTAPGVMVQYVSSTPTDPHTMVLIGGDDPEYWWSVMTKHTTRWTRLSNHSLGGYPEDITLNQDREVIILLCTVSYYWTIIIITIMLMLYIISGMMLCTCSYDIIL